jgi:hypothetical protein
MPLLPFPQTPEGIAKATTEAAEKPRPSTPKPLKCCSVWTCTPTSPHSCQPLLPPLVAVRLLIVVCAELHEQ